MCCLGHLYTGWVASEPHSFLGITLTMVVYSGCYHGWISLIAWTKKPRWPVALPQPLLRRQVTPATSLEVPARIQQTRQGRCTWESFSLVTIMSHSLYPFLLYCHTFISKNMWERNEYERLRILPRKEYYPLRTIHIMRLYWDYGIGLNYFFSTNWWNAPLMTHKEALFLRMYECS